MFKSAALLAVSSLINEKVNAQDEVAEEELLDQPVDEDTLTYNYLQNGADWPESFPDCGLSNQSPIDLPTKGLRYITADEDNLQKIYTNQSGGVVYDYADINPNTMITNEGQSLQQFRSSYAQNNLGATDTYNGKMFTFKAGAEHTIDGYRHDLEMQVVHTAAETNDYDVKYAAVSVIFSVEETNSVLTEDQIATIDTFFDSLQWSNDEPVIDSVNFGDLMMLMDMNNRWVYQGSVTNPPCDRFVYWNVLKTIYPIKQAHLDQFKTQLLASNPDTMTEAGNWRVTSPVELQNPVVIEQKSINIGGNLWDYEFNGADWPEKYPECAASHQSPINLLTPFSEFGQAYDIYDAAVDNVIFWYFDLPRPKINLDRSSRQVNFFVDHSFGYAGIESTISRDVFESQSKWDAYEFKLHAAAEHTIDGNQYDIELQILHKPYQKPEVLQTSVTDQYTREQDEEEVESVVDSAAFEAAEDAVDGVADAAADAAAAAAAALGGQRRLKSGGQRNLQAATAEDEYDPGEYSTLSIGILYSVDQFDEISDENRLVFDEFFDNLQLGIDDPVVDSVAVGAMMEIVNLKDRWVYKGSRTVPPCDQFTLWQVLSTVYPVKQSVVDNMINKMEKVGAAQGNFRVIQTGFNPDVAFISSGAMKIAGAVSAIALGLAALF